MSGVGETDGAGEMGVEEICVKEERFEFENGVDLTIPKLEPEIELNEEPPECEEDFVPMKVEPEVIIDEDLDKNDCSKDFSGCSENNRDNGKMMERRETAKGIKDVMYFTCDECGRCMTSLKMLARHIGSHGKHHECLSCGKLFKRSGDLKKHTRTHTGEKPFECEVCGRGFRQQPHLKDHMTTHTGLRPHVCTGCGQRFTKASCLNKHAKRHCGKEHGGRRLRS